MLEPSIWDLYRTFLTVMQDGSLSAAARRLRSTQPTIGRQIEKLEQILGVSLFARSTRGIVPTPIARELLVHAEAMAASAAAMARAASNTQEDKGGVVRLTVPEYIAFQVLPPFLSEFVGLHPGIELELSATNRNEDLLRRDADIAVRMVRPTQKALVARRLGSVAIGLFAHRRYIAAVGLPMTMAEVFERRAIGFDRDLSVLMSSGGVATTLRREDFRFRTDNVAVQQAAMNAGIGITACHELIAKHDIHLVPVLPNEFRLEREMWLVMHEDASNIHRIRLLYDHLAERLSAYVRGVRVPSFA